MFENQLRADRFLMTRKRIPYLYRLLAISLFLSSVLTLPIMYKEPEKAIISFLSAFLITGSISSKLSKGITFIFVCFFINAANSSAFNALGLKGVKV